MRSFLLIFLTLSLGFAPLTKDIGNDIAAAIRAGNARQLSGFFNNNVDLTVLGKEEMYSKAQAEQILRDFFQKNAPRSFNLKHHSSNPTSAQYGIGTYVSMQNARFRIYFLIKKIGNQSFIQQFSIEPEI
ncbi:MAG TPA: DUF4783 domain-containing protein [Flavobacteriales bacterium]|nr:DUF4783 domain-containing protein [Flavobacteriales bacterium]